MTNDPLYTEITVVMNNPANQQNKTGKKKRRRRPKVANNHTETLVDKENITVSKLEQLRGFLTSEKQNMPVQHTEDNPLGQQIRRNVLTKKSQHLENKTEKKNNKNTKASSAHKQMHNYENSDLSFDKNDKVNQNGKTPAKKKNKSRKTRPGRRGINRCFGKFTCKICNRGWTSSLVWAIAGTKRVIYKQRCKACPEGWWKPWDVQVLTCRLCDSETCQCVCADCERLVFARFVEGHDENPVRDDRFKYCRCKGKGSKMKAGLNIDMKKPHRADLCEKCKVGRPCVSANDTGYLDFDNEQ